MSRQLARDALDQLSGRPSFMAEQYAGQLGLTEVTSSRLTMDLQDLAEADHDKQEAEWLTRKQLLASTYGYSNSPLDKPFAFADGKAIIPVHGILLNRFNYSWGFITGYNFIRNQIEAAWEDPDVDGIIYDGNSYGGTVAGCQETTDAVYSASRRQGGKPSLFVIDANCFSACYMIASSADRIVITPSGEVGSVGVVQMHIDVSSAMDKAGIKVTFQYAGDHKIDGSPFAPLNEAAKKDRQAKIDAAYDMFVGKVARGRKKMTEQKVRDTQALCYGAEIAIQVGLVDAIALPDEAVSEYFSDDFPYTADDDAEVTSTYEDEMAVAQMTTPAPAQTGPTAEQIAADQATAANTARHDERTRIAGITGHVEAAGRTKLASHLAMSTSMSVEDAGAVLAAAEKAPEVTSKPPAAAAETNRFKAAMDADAHPSVGTGDGGGSSTATVTPGERILAAQRSSGSVRTLPRA